MLRAAHTGDFCTWELSLFPNSDPGITLYLTREMFPSSLGDVQDPLGQLLPLHPTLPLIYPPPQQLKVAASSCQASLHDSLSPDLHI